MALAHLKLNRFGGTFPPVGDSRHEELSSRVVMECFAEILRAGLMKPTKCENVPLCVKTARTLSRLEKKMSWTEELTYSLRTVAQPMVASCASSWIK